MLGQGGLTRAVVAQDSHEGAGLNLQIHPVQDGFGLPVVLGGVGEVEVFGFQNRI